MEPISMESAVAEATPLTRDRQRLEEVSRKVVGSVFYGTLLAAGRSNVGTSLPGHGGRGEDVFRAQRDQLLAETAGQAEAFDLARVIYSRYAKQQDAIGQRRVMEGDVA